MGCVMAGGVTTQGVVANVSWLALRLGRQGYPENARQSGDHQSS
jgi:hypothetical protein